MTMVGPNTGSRSTPKDGLDASRHYRGDKAAVDGRVRLGGAGGGEDLVESGLRGDAVGDAETDTPDVALVKGFRGQNLEDEGGSRGPPLRPELRRQSGLVGGNGRNADSGEDVEGGELVDGSTRHNIRNSDTIDQMRIDVESMARKRLRYRDLIRDNGPRSRV